MFLTDPRQIDSMFNDMLDRSRPSSCLNIDMNDYRTIMNQSVSFKAFKVGTHEISEEFVIRIRERLEQAGNENAYAVLLYICINESKFTMTDLELITEPFRNFCQNTDLIWGIRCVDNEESFGILTIIGYRQ